jgi:ribonuclease E
MFASYRIDEQLAKALDRKVWLPSGGSLVIDRTEAMTVVDVNTGKFTGQGGNLEETVTSNNIEAAEEIVRQLRLRDIGGIIVIDFIDMVLESNRDLVLRRLVECLGRDRTKHQVAEVTTLGLVQMTRKRIGQGLLEVFSESCESCHGRGYHIHSEPVAAKAAFDEDDEPNPRGRKNGDAEAGGGRTRSRGRTRPIEVEPRAIDPEVSAVLERIHAAAAKSTTSDSGTDVGVDTVSEAVTEVARDAARDVEVAAVETESTIAVPVVQAPAAAESTSSSPRKRGSRRATRASGSSPVTTVTSEPAAEPIVVVSSPAPAVVTVKPQVIASLVELDPTPAPRARGPRKATRSAGPASTGAGSAVPTTSETSD